MPFFWRKNWPPLTQDQPKVSVRKKLLSELGSSLEGISPVTLKDVRNMQVSLHTGIMSHSRRFMCEIIYSPP
jgi:hypothetical protein